MEEKESNFLEEVKGLIEKYQKEEIPEKFVWNDKRNPVVETTKKIYENSIEGELLQEIDETRDPLKREELIEKLKTEVQARKKTLKSEISRKTQKFINENNVELDKLIKVCETELKEMKRARSLINKNKQKIIKNSINLKDNEVIYTASRGEAAKMNEQAGNLTKKIDDKSDELQKLRAKKIMFNECYGTIDFSNETFTEKLSNAIKQMELNKKPETEPKPEPKQETEQQPEMQNENAENIDDEAKIKYEEDLMWESYKNEEDASNKASKNKAEEEINEHYKKMDEKEAIFREIENGYEDLLTEQYKRSKKNIMEQYSAEEIKKAFEGKTMYDIYEYFASKDIDVENLEKIQQRQYDINKRNRQPNQNTNTQPNQNTNTNTNTQPNQNTNTNNEEKKIISAITIDARSGKVIVEFKNNEQREKIDIEAIMNRSKDINYQNANKYDSLTDEEKEKLEKTANPVIVEILDKYGKNGDVDMLKEYFNNILNKDNENLQSCKVPDVYYYLARNESLSKATYKAMKKYAKNEEDMPKTCADYKKTIWDKIVAFFNKNKKKIKQLSSRNKRTVKNKAKTRSSLRGKNILKQLGKVKDNVKDMAAEFRDKLRRSAAKQGKNQTYNAYENGSKAWKLHNMDEFDTSDAVEGVFREWGHDDSVTYADDGDKKEEEL